MPRDGVEVLAVPTADMTEDRFAPSSQYEPISAEVVVSAFFSPADALGPAGHLGDKPEVEKELDLIAAAIRVFHRKPADAVMRECSAYTARLTELCVLLHRREAESRHWTRVRTQQVQRFLDELDRQWKTASRLIEVQRQDIAVTRGIA